MVFFGFMTYTPAVFAPPPASDVSLVWASDSEDSAPQVDVYLPTYASVDDTVDLDFSLYSDFSSYTRVTRVVTAEDMNSGAYTAGSLTLDQGYWYVRARLTHDSVVRSWSDSIQIYLDDVPPEFTSANGVTLAENTALTFPLTASEPVTFTLSGYDAAVFEVNGSMPATSATLRRVGNTTFDYETPYDADNNDVYTFTVTARDRGTPGLTANQTFTVTVTNSADSSNTAPSNVQAPVASGGTTVGALVSTTNGVWTASPLPTFTYQWKRDGVDIASATASTYTLVTADIGPDITCTVTATNGSGNASSTTNAIYTWTPDLLWTASETGDWWLASTAKMWQDTGNTTPVSANNDPVGHWEGQKNGRDVIQSTTGAKPRYNAGGWLTFNGANTIMTDNTGTLGVYAAGQCTVFTVGKFANNATSQDAIFCEGRNGSSNPIFTPIVAKTSNTQNAAPNIRDDAGTIILNEASGGDATLLITGAFDGTAHSLVAVDNGTGITGYRDNTAGTQRNYSPSRSTLTLDQYSIGGRYLGGGATSTWIAGDVVAVGAIGRAINSTERGKLQTWAANKIAALGL